MKHRLRLVCCFLALLVSLHTLSFADPIVTWGGILCGGDGVCTSQANSVIVNFNDSTHPGWYQLAGAYLTVGNNPPYDYAAAGDITYYLTTGPNNGLAVIQYPDPWTYFGLY